MCTPQHEMCVFFKFCIVHLTDCFDLYRARVNELKRFGCWLIIDAVLCCVQSCHPCHPQCRGCEGHSAGLCIECVNYKQSGRCVESCFSDYFVDEANKQCIECDRQCLECHGPTAAHCTSCRFLKLYHNLDDRGPDSPVCLSIFRRFFAYYSPVLWDWYFYWCLVNYYSGFVCHYDQCD